MGNCLKPERHWADEDKSWDSEEYESGPRRRMLQVSDQDTNLEEDEIETPSIRITIVITKKELRALVQHGLPIAEINRKPWKPSLKTLQEVRE